MTTCKIKNPIMYNSTTIPTVRYISKILKCTKLSGWFSRPSPPFIPSRLYFSHCNYTFQCIYKISKHPSSYTNAFGLRVLDSCWNIKGSVFLR